MNEATVQRLFQLQRERYVFEDIIRAVYEHLLRPGDVAVDGGANIGDHAIPMSRSVGAHGTVYAFEPVPATVELLKSNLAASGASNVDVRMKALGATAGASSFVWVENRATRSALKSPNLLEGSRTRSIEVQIVALDEELANETRTVRFIKLDLEGGEFDCLKGARTVLSKHRPVIVLENGSQASAANYGYSKDEFFALFANCEYSLLDLFGRPYGARQWAARDVPYYTFAVPGMMNSEAVAQTSNIARLSALALSDTAA